MLTPTHTQIHDLVVYFLSIHGKQNFNESDVLKKTLFVILTRSCLLGGKLKGPFKKTVTSSGFS